MIHICFIFPEVENQKQKQKQKNAMQDGEAEKGSGQIRAAQVLRLPLEAL